MSLPSPHLILAIETSLDDTCAAVVKDNRVLSNVVASQVKFHEEFGGTVPHVAKRKHLEWIDRVVEEAMTRARVGLKEMDAIAVTYGPGLAPSLEVGIAKAKTLVRETGKPLIAVNHMEGHLLSALAKNSQGKGNLYLDEIEAMATQKGGSGQKNIAAFPGLGFLISGGHTELVLVKAIGDYVVLGRTLDDAAGEAYDKVARMLKLGYPGGPILSELAKMGTPRFDLPEPMKHRKDLNFSFSGIKTASLYFLKQEKPKLTRSFTADFAASFQEAVMKMLERRLARAIRLYKPKMLLMGGGVVSNVVLRTRLRKTASKHGIPTYIPYSKKLFTDNAAMIGVAAWYQAQRGDFWDDPETLEREPNLSW